MIVPVQARPVALPTADLPPSAAGTSEDHSRSAGRVDARPASIQVDRLVLESSAPISTAAIRDGFREAWLRHDHAVRRWTAEAFRGGLTIDLPSGITGRELGRRIALAILQRASSH